MGWQRTAPDCNRLQPAARRRRATEHLFDKRGLTGKIWDMKTGIELAYRALQAPLRPRSHQGHKLYYIGTSAT